MAFKLVSKNYKHSKPSFWVEDYTDAEKLIFEKMGFVETVYNVPKAFGIKNTLNFKGSGVFGLFTEAEYDKIAVQLFGAFKLTRLVIYEAKER